MARPVDALPPRLRWPSKGCRLPCYLPAVAQAGGDAVDGEVDALRRRPSSAVAAAVALQQLDLHVVERIEVGEAVADRAREQRVALQQRLLLHDREQGIDRCPATRRAGARRSLSRSSASADQLGVARGDGDVALGQHHVHVRQQRLGRTATPGTCACSSAHAVVRMRRQPRLDGRAEAVPAGQHQPALRPAEHPGDGAQVLDARRGLARGRPAADVELGDLADHRRFPEVALEARRLVDQVAIGAEGAGRQLLHRRQVFGARRRLGRRAAASPRASRRQGSRGCAVRPRGWSTCWRSPRPAR